MRDVDAFCAKHGFEAERALFEKAALVAQDKDNWQRLAMLSDDERAALQEEKDHRWRGTKSLWFTVFVVSFAACLQGMDESVINGANLFYPEQFGIGGNSRRDTMIEGFVNSSPYLCAGLFSCWMTYPLNNYFGRRGTICIGSTLSGIGCIWSACTNTWWHLVIARFFLGLGIGPNSATAPILAAEVAPPAIRGALCMQWQVWTAFGIMLGTVSSLIFKGVPDPAGVAITGLNWRLMLGSAVLPALVVAPLVLFCPESPRWLLQKGRHQQAWLSFQKYRRHPILAARELIMTATLIDIEKEIAQTNKRNPISQMLFVPRNRRAVLASSIVMFGQQFCGVNAIAYFSSTIFTNAGASQTKALLGSFGYGLLNWVFALPAFFTIDTFGRRNLMLVTFPCMAICLVIAGCGFLIKDNTGQLGLVTTGVYLFTCFYSPGMGPVPFSYSAEVYPVQIREVGMALATATTWIFNSVVALTFPLLIQAFTSLGAFMWYAGWNAILFCLVLLFCPETAAFTLEELDEVFSMSTRRQALYGLSSPVYAFRKYILRQKVNRIPLHEWHPSEEKNKPNVDHIEKA